MTDWDRSAGRPVPPPRSVFGGLVAGVGVALGLHGVVGALMLLVMWAGSAASSAGWYAAGEWSMVIAGGWLMFIGLTQGAYLLPAFVIAWIVRRPVALGVAIGAAATFLLNGACFGWVFATFRLH